MKKENGKKSKLWLWLLLAVVAIAAAVAVVLVMLPGGNGGQEETPGEETVQSEIYWNIDGAHYMEISEVAGMSAREIGEDGFYHILFLVNGERKELLVADKRLVNYIDSMQLMGLLFDENGNVIDALDVKTIATEVAKEFFVKKLENGVLIINSSRAMNGMPLEVIVDENTGIFDMTLSADELGKPGTPEQMDKVNVYQSPDGSKTFVYIVEKAPEESEVYWRVERCWDSTAGKTTRVPDKKGVYTLQFSNRGQLVELKCKDAAIVSTIDSSAVLTGQFAFEFDEEGYIKSIVNVTVATRSIYAAGDYHVTAVDGKNFTVTRLSSGADQGKVQNLTLAEEYNIYQCCQYACYEHNCGERVDSVQVGDRVNVYTNLDGEAFLIFVTRRMVDSPMYYNFNRQYGGNMEVGTLREKTGGYYVFEMLAEGKVVKVKVKDKKIADRMESIYNRCMGLELDRNNVVQRVFDGTCVTGSAVLGTESFVTSLTGPVITIASGTSDTTWNSILSDTCKVYNVIQGEYGAKIGGELTLQEGDQMTAFRNIHDQLEVVFVMSRPVSGGKVYYNLQRKYNSTTQETNRVPDEEGYYQFLLASEGKQVTAKTKNKGLASFIDAQTAPLVGLKINKNGIITNAYVVTSVLKQSAKACNYRYVENVKKGSFNTFYYPAATPDKKLEDTTTWKIAKDCVIYNVSTAVTSFRGEKATLKNGDYIQAIRNLKTGEITQIWIMTRNPAYGVKNYEAYCEHCDQKVTWEPYIGKVVSGTKHYFLFTDMFYSQGTVGTKTTDDATFDTVLDLNGKTLNGDGRCFLVYDHLTIMDTKGGGKLMGTNPSSAGDKHSGGCIMVAGGKLDILGGTLGQNPGGEEKGTIAGVIYLAGGVEVNMYGGTLMNGITTVNGGCVGNYGGTFNMYGGEIKGGQSPLGANIYSSSGNINLMGGTVDGGIEVSASTKLQLSGKLTITGTGLKVPAGAKVDPTLLAPEARIAVDAVGVFTEAYENIQDYLPLFTTVLEGDRIDVRNNALFYISTRPSDFVLDTDNDGMAVCPACNQDVAWMPVTGRLGASMVGHYYLNADINDNSSQWATITTKDAALCIHMNGHTLNTSGRIATVGGGGTINIMGDGTIIGEGDYTGTDAESYTQATLIARTGPINLYGNVKVTTTAEGKPVVYNRVGFSLNDNAVIEGTDKSLGIQNEKNTVTLNGGSVTGGILAEGGTIVLGGNTTVDSLGIKKDAKLKVLGDWTGTADSKFENAMVEGAVPSANGQSTGAFTGTLRTLDPVTGTSTQLFGKNGRLATADAEVAPPEPDFVLDPDGDNKAVCPVCGGAEVEWTPVDGRVGSGMTGHYYLAANINDSNFQWATITTKDAALCIHMNGKDLITSGRIATVGSGGTINIMGDGTITGEGDFAGNDAETATKATLVANTGPINLYGNVKVTTTAAGKPVVYNRVGFTLNDNAVIEGSDESLGIRNEKATATLNGGSVTGGILAEGGTIVLGGSTNVDIIGVQDAGKLKVLGNWTGTAEAVFANAMEDGVVPAANGESTGEFTGTLNILDPETGAPTQLFGKGGRLATADAQVTPKEPDFVLDPDGDGKAVCPVCGGTEVEWKPLEAGQRPGTGANGHFYLLEGGTNADAQYATTLAKEQKICLHLNGKDVTTTGRIAVVGAGGNIHIMGKGTINSLASSAYAEATLVISSGGSINLYDDVTVTIAADGKPVAEIRNNSALNLLDNAKIVAKEGGVGILNKGKLFLNDATAVDNITVESSGKVTVNGNWTGSAKVTFAAALEAGVVPAANGASTGAFTGSLTMDGQKLVGSDGKLMLEGTAPSDPVDPPTPPTPPATEGELELDGNNQAMCPACQKVVTWTAVTASLGETVVDGAHYYLTGNYDNPYQFMTVTKGKTVCFHNNGYTLTYPSRIFVTGATLNMMGSGQVIGKNTTADTNLGVVVAAWANGVINIYGGTYSCDTDAPALKLHGDMTVKVNVYGDTVIESADIHKGTLTLYGNSRIENLNVQAAGKLVIDSSWAGSAKVTFESALAEGVVPEANGAATGDFTGTLTLGEEKLVNKDGTLALESATNVPDVPEQELVLDAGGYGYCEACKETVQWTDLHTTQYNRIGWKEDDAAANIHYHFYLSADLDNQMDLQFAELYNNTTCLHTNGHDLKIRSRLRMGTGATMNVLGSGSITTDSTATNTNYNNALFFINSTAKLNIYGGTYSTAGVPVLMINDTKACQINLFEGVVINGGAELKNGTLTLDGNASITSINLTANAKLVVNAGWSGTAAATFASSMVDGAVPSANGASTGAFTGKLIVEGKELIGKDGLLKVNDVDPQVTKGNAVATAAAAMDFSTYQAGTAVQCPVCQKDVTWEPINGMGKAVVDGGHYYVNKDISGDGIFLTVSGKVVCVHLNGKTLSYGARIFATSANSTYPGTLNLMGSGTVSSSNTHADYGTGTIHATSAGIINLYGGTYKSTGANTKATVHTTSGTVNIYSGATIDSNTGTNVLMEKGTVNLYGGTIQNGTGYLSGSNLLGGNVFLMSSGSVFNMVDGTITGGTATYGGNVRCEAGTTFTMADGQITGGQASGGAGNVNCNGTFTMNGGVISGGQTTGSGGNIWSKGGVITIGKNATVFGGTAKEGGNIMINTDGTKIGTLNTCGTIYGGTTSGSAAHGGNISGSTGTVINITGGAIYNGTAAGQAGNVRTYNGTLTISGGEIYGGTSLATSNHNVWAAGDSGVLYFLGGTIKGLNGSNASGTAITIGTGSTFYLGGNAVVKRDDGINKSLIHNYNGKLYVLNDFTGSASMKFASSYTAGTVLADTVAQCGSLTDGVFTAGGSYTGTLMNEQTDVVKILGVDGVLVLDQLPAAE